MIDTGKMEEPENLEGSERDSVQGLLRGCKGKYGSTAAPLRPIYSRLTCHFPPYILQTVTAAQKKILHLPDGQSGQSLGRAPGDKELAQITVWKLQPRFLTLSLPGKPRRLLRSNASPRGPCNTPAHYYPDAHASSGYRNRISTDPPGWLKLRCSKQIELLWICMNYAAMHRHRDLLTLTHLSEGIRVELYISTFKVLCYLKHDLQRENFRVTQRFLFMNNLGSETHYGNAFIPQTAVEERERERKRKKNERGERKKGRKEERKKRKKERGKERMKEGRKEGKRKKERKKEGRKKGRKGGMKERKKERGKKEGKKERKKKERKKRKEGREGNGKRRERKERERRERKRKHKAAILTQSRIPFLCRIFARLKAKFEYIAWNTYLKIPFKKLFLRVKIGISIPNIDRPYTCPGLTYIYTTKTILIVTSIEVPSQPSFIHARNPLPAAPGYITGEAASCLLEIQTMASEPCQASKFQPVSPGSLASTVSLASCSESCLIGRHTTPGQHVGAKAGTGKQRKIIIDYGRDRGKITNKSIKETEGSLIYTFNNSPTKVEEICYVSKGTYSKEHSYTLKLGRDSERKRNNNVVKLSDRLELEDYRSKCTNLYTSIRRLPIHTVCLQSADINAAAMVFNGDGAAGIPVLQQEVNYAFQRAPIVLIFSGSSRSLDLGEQLFCTNHIWNHTQKHNLPQPEPLIEVLMCYQPSELYIILGEEHNFQLKMKGTHGLFDISAFSIHTLCSYLQRELRAPRTSIFRIVLYFKNPMIYTVYTDLVGDEIAVRMVNIDSLENYVSWKGSPYLSGSTTYQKWESSKSKADYTINIHEYELPLKRSNKENYARIQIAAIHLEFWNYDDTHRSCKVSRILSLEVASVNIQRCRSQRQIDIIESLNGFLSFNSSEVDKSKMNTIWPPSSAASGKRDPPGVLTQTSRAASMGDSKGPSFIFRCNALVKWYRRTACFPISYKALMEQFFLFIQRTKHKSNEAVCKKASQFFVEWVPCALLRLKGFLRVLKTQKEERLSWWKDYSKALKGDKAYLRTHWSKKEGHRSIATYYITLLGYDTNNSNRVIVMQNYFHFLDNACKIHLGFQTKVEVRAWMETMAENEDLADDAFAQENSRIDPTFGRLQLI
eukprot:bmy_13435T0